MSTRSIPSVGRSLESGGRAVDIGGLAVAVTIIEDWEDTDPLSEWDNVNTGSHVVSTVAFNGSNTYMADNFEEISSVSGLPAYFQKGEEMNWYLRTNDGGSGLPWLGFGADATTPREDYYAVGFSIGGNSAQIKEVSNNSADNLASDTSVTLNADVWYEANIVWDDGTLGGSDNDITVTITDTSSDTVLTTLNANDATLATESGHVIVGQSFNTGQEIYVDYLHKV